MENKNVITCHSCRVCGEETKEKHRRNWYDIISTPYTPSIWPSYQRTSKLPCSIHSEKAAKETTKAVSMVQRWNKKMVPSNLYAIHAKWVTITLKDIQIISQYLQWKSCKVENENSIHGTELKQNSIHGAELKQNSIHGTELKTEQYTWCRAETEQYKWCRAEAKMTRNKMMKDDIYTSYLTKKTRSKMTKDEFFASYLKKDSTALKK